MEAPAAFVLALLADRPPGGIGPLRAGSPAAERVVALLRLHGLEGLAVATHRRGGGRLLPAALVRELEPAYRRTALWTTLHLEAGERARHALAVAGVPALLFKGAALVRAEAYPDPGARRMDDVDLLVPEGAADAAVAVLTAEGFRPWEPWEPSKAEWLDSASFHDPTAPTELPVSIDLHWRTGYGRMRFGGAELSEAAAPSTERRDSGGDVGRPAGSSLWDGADLDAGRPGPASHLVLLAEHFLKHLRYRVHLAALADLVRMARRELRADVPGARDAAGWDAVLAYARASPLASGIGALLGGLRDELDMAVPDHVVEGLLAPGPLARGALETVRPSRLIGVDCPVESRAGGLLLRWRLLGTPARILRDLRHAALPSARWLRARYARGDGGGRGAGATPVLWLRYARHALRWVRGRRRSPASPNQEMLERLER